MLFGRKSDGRHAGGADETARQTQIGFFLFVFFVGESPTASDANNPRDTNGTERKYSQGGGSKSPKSSSFFFVRSLVPFLAEGGTARCLR